MKRLFTAALVAALSFVAAHAQAPDNQVPGKEVARTDDVVFRQIDEHTWVGTGNQMFNESLYLVEGSEKAVLIDAGTKIANLDKIVASITKKPVMLVATHAHPDHTGSSINLFPELYLNPGDMKSQFVAAYTGKMKELKDGEVIDLGGRTLQVVFTPAHTPGSTTFLDASHGYGFSGDSFGSGNLLLSGTFSTLKATCEHTNAVMEKLGIKVLYPGHYFGSNLETRQRLMDEASISARVLSGELKGVVNPQDRFGLKYVISEAGVRINYNEASVQ